MDMLTESHSCQSQMSIFLTFRHNDFLRVNCPYFCRCHFSSQSHNCQSIKLRPDQLSNGCKNTTVIFIVIVVTVIVTQSSTLWKSYPNLSQHGFLCLKPVVWWLGSFYNLEPRWNWFLKLNFYSRWNYIPTTLEVKEWKKSDRITRQKLKTIVDNQTKTNAWKGW